MLVAGLIALVLIAIVYLFVTAGGILWPGGPQLQPAAARNLSISLLIVELLLCGVLFGSLTQLITSPPLEIGGGAGPGAEFDAAGATANAQAGTPRPATATGAAVNATPTFEVNVATNTLPGPSETATALVTGSPIVPTSTATPAVTPTREAPSPTPTPLPTALPLDPRTLVETVLRAVIERANDAEVDAILSGDETDVDPWWSGQARDRVLDNVRRVRSRFVTVTEVTWVPVGEGIQLLSSSVATATYTTSETWTFVGTTNQLCPDGSPRLRRTVETYPVEQYTLVLQDGVYSVAEWQLGRATIEEDRAFCPQG